MSQNEIIIGIDLGTTNSEVAVLKDGKIEVIEEHDSPLLPSIVGLNDQGKLIVGQEARNQFILHPERTIRSIKRQMGTAEKHSLGDKEYLPQEISAMILKTLKDRAERYLGCPVGKAVITVPAYFSDGQRQATRDAGRLAGLEVARIINEPTAACLSYEMDDENGAKTVLAFDLGGGTFDVSIVRIEGELVEVTASHGDNHLGGDDFDDALYANLLNRFYEDEENEKKILTDISKNRLQRAAEDAKIALSNNDFVNVIEDNLTVENGDPVHFQEEVTQQELGVLIAPLLQKAMASVHQAIAGAGIGVADIDEIILIGGSTRIPMVVELLLKELGQPPRQDVHPDLAVVYGAAVMAARLQGSSEGHKVLIDITPYTFGTSVMGYLEGEVEMTPYCFVPIISFGTPLPVSKSKTFHTMVPGQEQVQVTIFEGDHHDARKNILIGKFLIEGLDETAPEHSNIIIHMSLDLNGILTVTATEKHTGRSKNIRIENSLGTLSEKELAASQKALASLWNTEYDFPDREEITAEENIETPAAFPEAVALITRTEQLLDSMDEVDQQDAAKLLQQLQQAIDNYDQTAIDSITSELDDLLFYLESGQ